MLVVHRIPSKAAGSVIDFNPAYRELVLNRQLLYRMQYGSSFNIREYSAMA